MKEEGNKVKKKRVRIERMERRADKKSCCKEPDESEVAEEEERGSDAFNRGEERKNYAWKEGREGGQEVVANEFGYSSSGL